MYISYRGVPSLTATLFTHLRQVTLRRELQFLFLDHLPSSERVKRLSKVETLRAAINYIAFLDQLLK